jgi:hypothetical protein
LKGEGQATLNVSGNPENEIQCADKGQFWSLLSMDLHFQSGEIFFKDEKLNVEKELIRHVGPKKFIVTPAGIHP